MPAKTTARDLTGELAFLTRALKAPTLRQSVTRLAERARAESWSHEEFLAACLQREVAAREAHGGEGRIRHARFPARKSLEEFDFDHARGLNRELIAHLGTLDFVTARENVVFLGPPGTGKTHLAIGLGIRACQAGHRVLFATAVQWVARLADAHPRHTAGRAGPPWTLPATGHRRGRLHPLRAGGGQPVLPARLGPLRTGQPDRHLQQALWPLG
jgi:DNA replication protein DnaC